MFSLISSGCATRTKTPKQELSYETKVHEVTYNYVDCGELKLSKLDILLEDPKQHPGSVYNQKVVTHNLIILEHKLKEAESLLQCYQNQVKKLNKVK